MTNSQTILIVDDDPRWRQTVADVLTDAGYKIAAFPKIPDPIPACQAAVLDVSLDPSNSANRDGLMLAQRLAPVPVILLTGLPEAELADFQFPAADSQLLEKLKASLRLKIYSNTLLSGLDFADSDFTIVKTG